MAAISNARDLILQSTVPRLTVTSVTIVPGASGFLKDKNVLALSPATLNLTTILVGFTAAATYNWYYASSLNPNTFTLLVSGTSYTSYSITNTAFLIHVGLGTSVVYKCKVTQPGWADAETTTTINYTKRANDIPVATLNKTSIVLPTSAADVVNYANSDSSITVSIGGVNIPYAASGSNSFSVETAITSGTVTVGAATTSTNIVTNDTRSFSVLSGMAAGNAPATITYTVSARDVDGVATLIPLTQTITKVTSGSSGTNGTRTAVLDMYQWSSTVPTTFPGGTASSYTWSSSQFTDPGTTNSWTQTPGAGAVGQTLYIISQAYADNNTTLTSNVTWSSTSPRVVGVYGSDGLNGSRTAFLEVYQWAATTPTLFPSGTSSYVWSSGAFSAPTTANNWSLTPGASTPGYVLYACSVRYSDTATSSPTNVTWNTSTAYAVGSAGTNGTNGTNSVYISYTNDSLTVPTATDGSSPVWTASGGLLQVYDGTTLLTLQSNTQTLSAPASGTPGYNLLISNVSGNTLTEPTITGATTTTATIGTWAGASLTVPTVYKITAYVRTTSNATVTISTDVSISPSKAGADSTVYYLTTTSPVITKIAPDAATSGVHSSISIQGKKVIGSTTTNYGWVTVTANGATETFPATDTADTAVTLAPIDAAAKTSYTIKMYNQAASGGTLLDTEVVNVVFRGATGITGTAGTRTAVLDMYIWSATAPTLFPSGSSTYIWSTAQFSDPTTTNSWLQIPGAGVAGQTLYIISQPYADTATTLTSDITWAASTPRVVGVYGTNGSRTAVLEIYQWSATAPTTYPSGTSTYTWSTGSFTAPTVPAGWSLTPGASTPGYTLWGYSISYSDTNTTPTSSITWSPAGVYPVSSTLVGTRTAVLDLYQWATTTPTTYPSGSSTYTWSTAQFTSPATLNGWTQTPGAGSAGQTLYIITQTHVNSLSTSTSSITWAATTPRVIGVYGSTGLTGTRTGVLEIYRWASTPPVTYPSGTSTYTWSNGSFTAPTVAAGWSVQPGAGSAGQTLYGYSIKYSDSAATATTSVTWNSDAIYAVGAAGQTGAIAVAAYKIVGGASLPAAPTAPTGTPISGNATGTTDWYTSPALTLTGTQWLFQAVGTLLSGTYTWDSQTFLATFKVGALSALSADLGSITAGSITGTTITGATIRTAASGSRVELNASDLKVYSGASAVLTIGPGAGSGGITSALYNYTATTANYFDSINSIVGIDISSTNRLNLGTANSYVATSFAPGATNTYELGGTGLRWQNIYTINAVTVGSDARLKTNIETSVLGLNFINALNPVSYKLIQGGRVETGEFKEITTGEFPTKVPIYRDVPGVRKHYGLIAQEVKVVLDSLNTGDFAGFVLENKDDPNSMHSLRYEEFISPLIKAVQELSAKITVLENRLNS